MCYQRGQRLLQAEAENNYSDCVEKVAEFGVDIDFDRKRSSGEDFP